MERNVVNGFKKCLIRTLRGILLRDEPVEFVFQDAYEIEVCFRFIRISQHVYHYMLSLGRQTFDLINNNLQIQSLFKIKQEDTP